MVVRWRLEDRELLKATISVMATGKHNDVRGAPVRVVGVEPIFAVADVARSVEHYRRLGFATSYHDEYYAFAHRDHLTIHLAQTDDEAIAMTGSIYMHVDHADHLAEGWRRAGVEVVGPRDFDYGKREGSHTDPDGNLIRFGSPLRASGQGTERDAQVKPGRAT